MDIALNLFLTLIAILSCREQEIFMPGKYLFPAERFLCSIREYTSFFTSMKCIPVKNEVYSRKECSWFSYGMYNSRRQTVTHSIWGRKMLSIWLPKRPAEEAMQKSNHWDAKLQLSEYKVTPIMVQSCNFRSVKLQTSKCNSKFFRFQLSIFSNH